MNKINFSLKAQKYKPLQKRNYPLKESTRKNTSLNNVKVEFSLERTKLMDKPISYVFIYEGESVYATVYYIDGTNQRIGG